MSQSGSDERKSFFALIRVELEDVTAEDARFFWEAIQGGGATIEAAGYEAAIVRVDPEDSP